MKKLAILISGILSLSLFVFPEAMAIPVLQLDIVNATYYEDFNSDGDNEDPCDKGVVTNDNTFTLQALWQIDQQLNSTLSVKKFFISSALLTLNGQKITSLTVFPSISIDGTPVNTWDYGSPDKMPPHGVFDTFYHELRFYFEPNEYASTGIYNVADGTGSQSGYIHDFDFNVTGLGGSYTLGFDLYTYDDKGKIVNAPFSHNGCHYPIPEPATMLLLGSGLLGLFGIGFRKKRKA